MKDTLAVLKNEIGKPHPLRGAKARSAAIKFEEHFRDREFTSSEFEQWRQNESSLSCYPPHKARYALAMAGTRDDIPQPFQIVRTSKQGWMVQPIEKLIFSDQVPESMRKFFKRCRIKIRHTLQAVDWNGQDHSHRVAARIWFNNYNGLEKTVLLNMSTMREMVAMLEDGDLFSLPKNVPDAPDQ
jgi:hypothetical protein